MRFFAVLALAAAASAATLQRRQSFPDCSQACLANADFGSCDPLDDSCLCNSSSFVSSVTNCITGACTGSDLTNAEGAAQQLCLAVGVTLTAAPSSTAGSSQTGAPSSTGAGTGSDAGSATQTAPAPTDTATNNNGAASHGVNALAALAAVGVAAFVL